MKASPTLTNNMQAVLADLIELHMQGKQAHWNIVGTNFRDLHLQLDEIVDAARAFADDMAERMRALHALPDGRSETVAKSTSLAQFPQGLISTKDAIDRIVAALEAAVGTMRKVHDEVDEEDGDCVTVGECIARNPDVFDLLLGASPDLALVIDSIQGQCFADHDNIQPDILDDLNLLFLSDECSVVFSKDWH